MLCASPGKAHLLSYGLNHVAPLGILLNHSRGDHTESNHSAIPFGLISIAMWLALPIEGKNKHDFHSPGVCWQVKGKSLCACKPGTPSVATLQCALFHGTLSLSTFSARVCNDIIFSSACAELNRLGVMRRICLWFSQNRIFRLVE